TRRIRISNFEIASDFELRVSDFSPDTSANSPWHAPWVCCSLRLQFLLLLFIRPNLSFPVSLVKRPLSSSHVASPSSSSAGKLTSLSAHNFPFAAFALDSLQLLVCRSCLFFLLRSASAHCLALSTACLLQVFVSLPSSLLWQQWLSYAKVFASC